MRRWNASDFSGGTFCEIYKMREVFIWTTFKTLRYIQHNGITRAFQLVAQRKVGSKFFVAFQQTVYIAHKFSGILPHGCFLKSFVFHVIFYVLYVYFLLSYDISEVSFCFFEKESADNQKRKGY